MKKTVLLFLAIFMCFTLIACDSQDTATITCVNCGEGNAANAKFCQSCGKSVLSSNNEEENSETNDDNSNSNTDTQKPHEHNFKGTVTEPTCTTAGYTTYTCECGMAYKDDYKDATGHKWNEATCITPKMCPVCKVTEGEPEGHTFEDGECIYCYEDDPDYTALTLTSTKYNISLEDASDVAYITMIGGETVTYDIDDTSVVRCEWGEWDGDVIPLTFYPVSNGQTSVTIYIDNTNIKIVIDITVDSEQNEKLQRMSALGIETAYNSAKFPSTLRLSRVTYEDRINGYGDPITRMVIECYATNSFGGYGYIYVVVLCCEYETDYIDLEWDGLYFSTSAYSDSPGLCDYILDNEIAMNAYKNLTNDPKDIPYD